MDNWRDGVHVKNKEEWQKKASFTNIDKDAKWFYYTLRTSKFTLPIIGRAAFDFLFNFCAGGIALNIVSVRRRSELEYSNFFIETCSKYSHHLSVEDAVEHVVLIIKTTEMFNNKYALFNDTIVKCLVLKLNSWLGRRLRFIEAFQQQTLKNV